ncbi:hypothetical protein Pfo_000866 [Paulownia fortunei]|nr:hypothetical protein Pfo_000866 [Paulownia fortunei]
MSWLTLCREVCSADGLQNGKKLNDSSTIQNKDMGKTKSALRQREANMKDLDTLSSCAAFPCSSMEINKKAAQNSGNPTTLASIPTMKNIPGEGHKLYSIERGRKTPDLPGLKLPRLNLDSTKSPIRKDIKSVGNIGQNRVLLRKPPSEIARFPDSQKQTPSTLSMKRKTLEEDAADIIALHPPKRLSESPTASRNFVETSEKFVDKKVPNHNNMEIDRIKSTIGNCQVSTIHIPHEVKIKGVEMSFSIENDKNIKQAEAYSKELDYLCNMLRKKHDEAKEVLVQAIVNSNKLLMLNNPLFEEKISFKLSTNICATQNFFARLKLNS